MSALGPAVAGVLSGAVAIALSRRRNRPPRWLRPSTSAAEGYASIRSALEAQRSYPLRHRILTTLNERTASPAELAREVALPVPSVSHHVDQLLEDGAIERVSEHMYRAVDAASHSDDAWAALSAEQRAQITRNNVDRMVADLAAAAEGDGFQHRRSHQSWVPLELDERGFNEVAEVLQHALEAILAIRDESDARIDSGATNVHLDSEVVIAHFVRET
jgi:DNA-binding transcriptional ArsR family regulator